MKTDPNKLKGSSIDAVLLTGIKLITMTTGLVVTRLLSEYLSVYDYGTYSQIMLIVSTVTMLTILGMVDGVNYFYASIQELREREAYISTLYMLQTVATTAAGVVILLLSAPLCAYFNNPELANLLLFAAVLPIVQNLISMTHVLMVAVGQARKVALRNLVFALVRLGAAVLSAVVLQNVVCMFVATLVMDLAELVWFTLVLRKNGCGIRLKRIKLQLSGQIIRYCAPMAVFTVITALYRDLDKHLIAWMTDTETLAVYTNASKMLPFDIVMNSFCTILVPHITRGIAEGRYEDTARLYKLFLKIAYISTGILCCAALVAAPQLMQLLYSEKYLQGLPVFCIYILVDLLRFTNITMVLAAAGKTKKLMLLSIGALALNAVLNVTLYKLMGVTGPAVATLLVTAISGALVLKMGAKQLHIRLRDLFALDQLLLFFAEMAVVGLIGTGLRIWMENKEINYVLVVLLCTGFCGICFLALQGKNFLQTMQTINTITKMDQAKTPVVVLNQDDREDRKT